MYLFIFFIIFFYFLFIYYYFIYFFFIYFFNLFFLFIFFFWPTAEITARLFGKIGTHLVPSVEGLNTILVGPVMD